MKIGLGLSLVSRLVPAGAALGLLRSAELFLDADDYDGAAKWKNKGWGGKALDAQLGSTPVGWGAWVEDGALNLKGVSGNYASAPDSAALDVTGDIEIVVRHTPTKSAPASFEALASKWTDGGNQKSWILAHMPSGEYQLYYSADGSATSFGASGVASGYGAGTPRWVKVTLDVDNGAAGRDVKIYTAPDSTAEPSSWTQLGSTITTAGPTSVFSSSAPLNVGAYNVGGSSSHQGSISRAIVRNGIAGTTVFDANFANVANNVTSFTESSSNAATVTINRTAVSGGGGNYGTYIGNGALNLPGVAGNYASSPNSAALNITGDIEFEVYGDGAQYPIGLTQTFVARDAGGARSYRFGFSTVGKLFVAWTEDGSTLKSISSNTAVVSTAKGFKASFRPSVASCVFSLFEGGVWVEKDTVTTTTSSIAVTTAPMNIGAYGGGAGASGPLQGPMTRAIVRNGIGGTSVFDADFTIQPDGTTSFRESSSNAAVVTVNSTYNDTNDPLFLRGESAGSLFYSAASTNYGIVTSVAKTYGSATSAVVADAFVNSISAELAGWRNAGTSMFYLYINVSSLTVSVFDAVGSTIRFLAFPGSITPALNRRSRYRVTHDSITGILSGAYSLDGGTSWVSVGTVGPYTLTPLSGSPGFTCGSGGLFVGGDARIYGFQWIVDGGVVLDVDFSTLTEANQSTFVCQTGQTVTFNRSASGRKLVVMPAGGKSRWLFGTDDYMDIADNDLLDLGASDSFTAIAVVREWTNAGSGNRALIAKIPSSAGSAGWYLYTGSGARTPVGAIRDASTLVSDSSNSTPADGSVFAASMVVNRTANMVEAFNGSTSNGATSIATVTGSSANPSPVRVGSYSDNTPSDFECLAVAVFRRALTATELAQIAAYYQAA